MRTRPNVSSCRSASRTVVRPTLSWSASSLIGGSRSPGPNWPDQISCWILRATSSVTLVLGMRSSTTIPILLASSQDVFSPCVTSRAWFSCHIHTIPYGYVLERLSGGGGCRDRRLGAAVGPAIYPVTHLATQLLVTV